jgi:hypothetical protein
VYRSDLAYSQSKLAQILFTREARRRLGQGSKIQVPDYSPPSLTTTHARTHARTHVRVRARAHARSDASDAWGTGFRGSGGGAWALGRLGRHAGGAAPAGAGLQDPGA